MRVLHIFGAMNRGGAEMRTVSLMPAMNKKNITFDYCVLSGEKGVLAPQIEDYGGRIFSCRINVFFIFNFFRLLKNQKFDVVHSHVAYVSGLMVFIAWLAGIKIRIVHFRNTTAGEYSSPLRKLRDKFLKGLIRVYSTHILAVCYGAMEGFWGMNWQKEKRCQVIYNGFESTSKTKQKNFWKTYFPHYQNQKIVINVARMDEQKNHIRQCDMFIEIHKRDPETLMVFVGKENSEAKRVMEDRFSQHDILNKIAFLGVRSDVLSLMANADVMLFPSKWEGLPGVVIEAASVGLPVVASNLPGIVEIAQQISHIKIVKLSLDNNQWADAVLNYSQGLDTRNQMIEAFLKSDFVMQKNIDQLHAIYAK